MRHFFHLGRSKELAIAEIGSLVGFEGMELDGEYLSIDGEFDQKFQDRLGGTIAIYSLLGSGADIESQIVSDLEGREGKISFGIESNYMHKKDTFQILKKVKKNLKSSGHSVRFVESLNTASILGNGFLNGKMSVYNLLKFEGDEHLVKLVGIQNINEYTKRDMEKPYRDAKLGMLPPKLAQIMINLANPSGKVYDPFCGTGTVLIEAGLMGFDLKGSDIQSVNIEGSKKNLACAGFDAHLKVLDATRISSLDGVSAVVTEGFLGEPKSGNEREADLISELQELKSLYLQFLTAVAKANTNPDLSVVFSLPSYKATSMDLLENLVEKLKPLGYSVEALIPEGNPLGLSAKRSYIYKRDDQKVFRQIVRLSHIPG